LTDGSKYLAHILIKGLKSDFQPVVTWLMEIMADSQHFSELIKSEPSNSNMVFKALEGGLYSKNKDVVLWTLKVVAKLGFDFSSTELGENAWQWFTAKDGGLEGVIYSVKKMKELLPDACELMMNIGKGKLNELVKIHIKALFVEGKEYMQFLTAIMKPLSLIKMDESTKKELKPVLEDLLETACAEVDSDGRHTPAERCIALSLVSQLWLCFPYVFEGKDEVENYILNVLMRSTRDKCIALQYFSMALLFELLEEFGNEKRTFAPIIYKTLTFSLVELYTNVSVRQFVEGNLIEMYKQFPAMPMNVMLDPYAKQIQFQDYTKHDLNLCDFHFVYELLQHPKFPMKHAGQILDSLSQILYNDVVFSSTARNVILSAFNKADEPEGIIKDYILKFIKNSFNSIVASVKKSSKKKETTGQKKYHNVLAAREAEEREIELERQKAILAKYVISVLAEIQALEDKDQNDLIFHQALATHYRMKSILKRSYDPIKRLLRKYGNPDEEITKFEQAQEQFIAEKKEQAKILAIEGPRAQSTENNTMNMSKKSGESRYQLVPYKPYSEISQKAMAELEKIKKGRTEKEQQKKIQEEEKIKAEERKKKLLREQVERRHLELGVVSKSTKNVQDAIILSEGKLEKMQQKPGLNQIKKLAEFELINLDEEEERDKEGIALFMQQYRKLFRTLFTKYANTTNIPKKVAFDALKQKFELLTIAEFRKMLSDHGVDSAQIKNEELITLFRLINIKQERNDLVNVTYDGFIEAFVQTAIKIGSKENANLPFVELVKELKEKFRQADFEKVGEEGTMIYTDPDTAGLFPSDKVLIKELTKKVNDDPEFIIPEGYKKVTEKDVTISYSLQCIPANENAKICAELLDSIIFDEFSIHFIEPVVHFENKIKIRPIISKPKPSEKHKNEIPPPSSLKTDKKLTLPVGMKLIVAQLPIELRDTGAEVAGVVDDVLKAVAEGRSSIPGALIKNKVIEKRQQIEDEYKKMEEEREKKRKQRAQELKQKLEEKKKFDAENFEKKKAEEEEKARKMKEREEKKKEAAKKEIADRIARATEEKNKKMEEENKFKIENELKNKEEKEKKIKDREAFLKKKREEMVFLKNLLAKIRIN